MWLGNVVVCFLYILVKLPQITGEVKRQILNETLAKLGKEAAHSRERLYIDVLQVAVTELKQVKINPDQSL